MPTSEARTDTRSPTIPGTDVSPIDALVLLSGVNFGSIKKLLAAAEAIRLETGMDMDDFLRHRYVPSEPCNPADPAQSERAEATLRYVMELIEKDYADPYPVLVPSVRRLLHRESV